MHSTPFDTWNIDVLIQITPFALKYLFQASLGLFVTTLHWTSWCSADNSTTQGSMPKCRILLTQKCQRCSSQPRFVTDPFYFPLGGT